MTKTFFALLFLSTASVATVISTDSSSDSAPAAPAPAAAPAELDRDYFTDDKVAPTVKPDQYDLTIVEYTDYQCPYCRAAHPALQKLLASDKKVRIIYRDWPIFGAQSIAAARVGIASKYQGKHAAVHDALMKTTRPLTEQSIRAAVTKAGADWARLQADMKTNAAEIDALLERNNEQAEALGLQGTPAFIIGNYLHEGGIDYKSLQHSVQEARAKPAPPLKPAPQPAGI